MSSPSSTSSVESTSAPSTQQPSRAPGGRRRVRRPRNKPGNAGAANDTLGRDTTLRVAVPGGRRRPQPRATQVVRNIDTALAGVTHNNMGQLHRAGTCACVHCQWFFNASDIKKVSLSKPAFDSLTEYLRREGLSTKAPNATAFCPKCNTASLIPWRLTSDKIPAEVVKLRKFLSAVSNGMQVQE